MNELDELFFKYGADKTPRIKHHYSDVYWNLFKDRRESVKKVLEIGTAEGASLFAWRDFFPNAEIHGAEIDLKRFQMMIGQDRIERHLCDQSFLEDLYLIIENNTFDLIVDDGSHKPEDQLFSAIALIPYLNLNGVYIIEDVADPDILKYLKKYNPVLKTVGDRYDDRLIIIKK